MTTLRFALASLLLIAFALDSTSLAAPISSTVSTFADLSGGGGYAAAASTGPSYNGTGRQFVSAAVQGDVDYVVAQSHYVYDLRFASGTSWSWQNIITYTLAAEASAYQGAQAYAHASISFLNRDSGTVLFYDGITFNLGNVVGTQSDSAEKIDYTNHMRYADIAQVPQEVSATAQLYNLPTNNTYRIILDAVVFGNTKFDGPEAFFTASAFVDPQISTSVAYTLTQVLEPKQTGDELNWPPASAGSSAVPEPSTFALLGIGSVCMAFVGIRRRRKNKAA